MQPPTLPLSIAVNGAGFRAEVGVSWLGQARAPVRRGLSERNSRQGGLYLYWSTQKFWEWGSPLPVFRGA